MAGVYLEPLGMLYGSIASDAVASGAALPLTGGPMAFTNVRIWEGEPGKVKHAIVRASTILAIEDATILKLLERLVVARSFLAGLSLSQPRIMGIVNVTPDSFSDGGQHETPESAVSFARQLIADGADLIDIGGESTRPGAKEVTPQEELRRVTPVLKELALSREARISIDTRKPEIMGAAAELGAAILNDVSGLTYAENSLAIAAELALPTVIMHAKGDPKTMQENPNYINVVMEVYDFLEARIEATVAAGLPRHLLIADPGIGFGKTVAHNLSIFQSLGLFHGLGVPLLVGASRKSVIRDVAGPVGAMNRMPGSLAAALVAISQGVQIIRAHDIFETRQAILMWAAAHGQSPKPAENPARDQD